MFREAVRTEKKMKRRNESFCVARQRSWDGLAEAEKASAPFPYKKLEKTFKMNTLSCPAGLAYRHVSPVHKLHKVEHEAQAFSQLSKEIAKLRRSKSDDDFGTAHGRDRQAERSEQLLAQGSSRFQFRKCLNCKQLFVNTESDFIGQDPETDLTSRFCSGECYITHISKAGSR